MHGNAHFVSRSRSTSQTHGSNTLPRADTLPHAPDTHNTHAMCWASWTPQDTHALPPASPMRRAAQPSFQGLSPSAPLQRRLLETPKCVCRILADAQHLKACPGTRQGAHAVLAGTACMSSWHGCRNAYTLGCVDTLLCQTWLGHAYILPAPQQPSTPAPIWLCTKCSQNP